MSTKAKGIDGATDEGGCITPSRKDGEAEEIGTSVAKLSFGMVISTVAVLLFDASPASIEAGEFMVRMTDKLPLWFPFASVTIYAAIVLWHLYIRSPEAKAAANAAAKHPSSCIGTLLVQWNYFLTILSMVMLVGAIRASMALIDEGGGVKAMICDGTTMWTSPNPRIFWQYMFMWSKFPELIDTMFLVVRGRPILFLHWYHHVTVLLYCWMVVMLHYPGLVFCVINAGVHSIMYYYYARMAQGVRPKFGKILTGIQLAQMAVGVLVTISYVMMNKLTPEECSHAEGYDASSLSWAFLASGAMYGSYFGLFAMFYVDKWMTKKSN